MKIGELNEHCDDCTLIEYCTEPYETPELCTCEELKSVDIETYKEIADSLTVEQIDGKINQYEENDISPWTDERNGAICDLVLEALQEEIIKAIFRRKTWIHKERLIILDV